jgi:hypothetical protein
VLSGKVNEVPRITSDYQASTSNQARENLIHRPDEPAAIRKPGPLCLPAGERHVALAKANERAFRSAIKKLGYVLPQP